MAEQRLTVMISSTALDLPQHREQVMDACLRQSTFPVMMEHLGAVDVDAIQASLAMVDQADVYLGLYAYRYGTVPEGRQTSITEMEYRRAVERGIPRLLFVMADDHPVTPRDVETGPGAARLERSRSRYSPSAWSRFSAPRRTCAAR